MAANGNRVAPHIFQTPNGGFRLMRRGPDESLRSRLHTERFKRGVPLEHVIAVDESWGKTFDRRRTRKARLRAGRRAERRRHLDRARVTLPGELVTVIGELQQQVEMLRRDVGALARRVKRLERAGNPEAASARPGTSKRAVADRLGRWFKQTGLTKNKFADEIGLDRSVVFDHMAANIKMRPKSAKAYADNLNRLLGTSLTQDDVLGERRPTT